MNQKTNLILAVVFVVLGAAATHPIWGKRVKLPFGQSEEFGISLDVDGAESIEISRMSGEVLALTKSGGDWLVDGEFKASKPQVDALLRELGSLDVTRVASTNPDNFTEFSIASESGLLVKVQPGGDEVNIGNPGLRAGTYYLKPANEEVVYLVNGQLRSMVIGSQEDWRDKEVVDLETEKIGLISVNSPSETIVYTKNDDESWSGENLGRTTILGEIMAERLSQSFSPLTAVGFASEEEIASFAWAPKYQVSVVDKDGVEILTLSLVDDGLEWRLQVAGDETIYKIASSVAKRFILGLDELFVE